MMQTAATTAIAATRVGNLAVRKEQSMFSFVMSREHLARLQLLLRVQDLEASTVC